MIELGTNAAALASSHGGLGLQTGTQGAAGDVSSNYSSVNQTSATRFDSAMQRAENVQVAQATQAPTAAQPVQASQTAPAADSASIKETPKVTVSGPEPGSDARLRTLKSLELEQAVAPDAGPGQSILEGMRMLRGAFDSQQANISGVTGGESMGTEQMMAMQVEVVKYSMLIDVTSKLTGKTTQAFDTLMKGQ